jgi:hypothetical protein
MKRSLKNLFVIILILVSLVVSSMQVTPAYAQSSMEVVPLDLPDGWRSGYLNGVWGSSASDVYAVGYGKNNANAFLPLLYHNNGSGWSPEALGLPAGWRAGYLYGVWGSGASDVYAVGTGNITLSTNLPLLYHNNGSGWSEASPPLPSGWSSAYLQDVWGSSASDVYAVGYASSGSTTIPLIYHNNGSGWDPSTFSLPSGTSGYLYGVWGSSASDVYAVGYASNESNTTPLLYHNNGSGWSEASPAPPGGWSFSYLQDVWGSSASDVYAVGYASSGSSTPLIYHNTGSGWSDSTFSLPSGTSGYLNGVWGSSASDIYSAGNLNTGSTTPLLYHNNGSGWSEDSPSPPAGWISSYLHDVWGSSASDVYAVGFGNNGVTDLPLLYHSSPAGQDLFPPGDIDQATLTATSGTFSGSVDLSWTAPPDDAGDAGSGPVRSYLVKYSTSPFGSWNDGTPVTSGLPTPTAPGTTQTMTVSGLNPGTLYYFAIRAQDNQYNLSTNFATANATATSAGQPGKATLVSPTGTIGTNNPTYIWNKVPGATWYYLWVDGPSGNVIKTWYTTDEANCNSSTCSVTPSTSLGGGSHTWWIQTYNSVGYGPWSDPMTFTAPTPTLPGKATLVSPTGTIGTNIPTYTWNAVSGTTWYYLWVDGPSGNVVKTWYTAAQAGCTSGTGTCSVTPATSLGAGSHTWWIQTYNSVGNGPWSDPMTFTAPTPTLPGKATLVSPTGTIGTNNPTYTWNAVSGTTWYYLWVDGPSGNVIKTWYTAAQANCSSGTGTCSVANATPGLSAGSHTWWVQTYNSVGYGPWSNRMDFTGP